MRLSEPVRIGVEAAKANVVPTVVLWGFASCLVLAYYFIPNVSVCFERVRGWQEAFGWKAVVVSRILFNGLIPGAFLLAVKEIRPRRPYATIFAQTVFGCVFGLFCDAFFRLQSAWFGSGTEISTLVNPNQTPKLYVTATRAGYPCGRVIEWFKRWQIDAYGRKNFTLCDGVHGIEKSGGIEFIQSMLLQCDNGFVKLFPNWTGADASFTRLRAKGAFLVSAEMKGGRVTRVEIESLVGGTLRLIDPFGTGTPAGWTSGRTCRSGEVTFERKFAVGERTVLDAVFSKEAHLTLGRPFSDGLVLLRGRTVPVWGMATPVAGAVAGRGVSRTTGRILSFPSSR